MHTRFLSAIAALALTAAAANAQIELSENFSVNGFIDMSVLSDDGKLGMALDQMELDFAIDLGDGLGLQADIQGSAQGNAELEEAFMTYDAGDGLSLVAGKYLSVSGWETAEPTGLYQYSTSATLVYGGYQNGVGVNYSTDQFGLFGSVVTSVWDGTDTSLEEMGFELQLTLTPVEQVTTKIAYLSEDMGGFNQGLVNAWVAYFGGPLTLAAEVNMLSNWGADGNGGLGLLGMVNYGISDKIGITGRFSSLDIDSAPETISEFTISPSYTITENWSLIAEAKFISDGASDPAQFALESLISF